MRSPIGNVVASRAATLASIALFAACAPCAAQERPPKCTVRLQDVDGVRRSVRSSYSSCSVPLKILDSLSTAQLVRPILATVWVLERLLGPLARHYAHSLMRPCFAGLRQDCPNGGAHQICDEGNGRKPFIPDLFECECAERCLVSHRVFALYLVSKRAIRRKPGVLVCTLIHTIRFRPTQIAR